MLNENGQAFDAFKLLIAAVVAGAILVIIIGILRPEMWFFKDPSTEINNLIYQVKNTPGHASPGNVVTFRTGESYTANGISIASQLNPKSVLFCVSEDSGEDSKLPSTDEGDKITLTAADQEWKDACPDGYLFDNSATGAFAGSTKTSLTINKQMSGKIRAYRYSGDETVIFLGFKEA